MITFSNMLKSTGGRTWYKGSPLAQLSFCQDCMKCVVNI